jgi:gelsolin
MDPFMGAGKAPGLAIWRIDNFEPVPIPEQKFGTIFEGACCSESV